MASHPLIISIRLTQSMISVIYTDYIHISQIHQKGVTI